MQRLARKLLAGIALVGALGAPVVLAQDEKPPENKPLPANLDDIELDQVIDRNIPLDADKLLQAWAQRLGILIVVDQQMQNGAVKIKFLQQDVKLKWGLFKKVLDFYDIVLDEKEVNGRWIMFAHLRRNLPTKAAPPFPFFAPGEPLPNREEIVTAVIQIKNGAGNDIFATVRGLLVRDVNRIGNILYVRGPEVIIMVDYAANVEYYTKIIRAIDVPAPGQITRTIQIVYAPADDIVHVIQAILRPTGPGGQPGVPVAAPGGGSQAPAQVIADQRTNKLIIQAYPYQFEEIDKMIKELDVKAPVKPARFRTYKCRNSDANYLAQKLGELFGTGASGGSSGRGLQNRQQRQTNTGGTGGGNRPNQPTQPVNPQPTFGGGTSGPGSGKTDFTGLETRIIPDERNNILLIQAEEPIYKQILALLEGSAEGPGLDRAVRRVLIEAQIWEISTPTDNMTIGFELAAINNAKQGSFRPAGLTNFGLSSVTFDQQNQRIGRIPNLQNGVVAALTKDTFDKLPIILEAVASLEKSRLVTTPFALTNDNTPASFTINNKIPFQTSTLAGTGLSQGSVQFTDIKTELKVTPQVNSDESLTLQIDVQLSSIGAAGTPQLPPSTNERSYSGEVTVPNMKYVIFGGLESESYGSVESKVPFLGDIPILGHLFKQKTWTHQQSKIYIFVRPTIFSDDSKGLLRVSDDLRQKAHVEAERDEWLPPVVSETLATSPYKTVQDETFDVFGTGSGNPFGSQPKDD